MIETFSEEKTVKIIGNIGPFCAIARSVLVLGEHKKIIDNLKAKGKKEEERKAID